MGRLKAMAFDKTKTLTQGKPEVSDIISFNGFKKEEILACAAGLEVFSEHPIVRSITEKAKKLKIDTHKFHDFRSITGKGLTGHCTICKDSAHLLGSLKFIEEEENIKVDNVIVEEINKFENQGKTVIVMSEKNTIKGIIAIVDKLREESREMIDYLNNSGIKPVILTGDSSPSAGFVSSALGIEEYKASLLPQDKADEVEKLKNGYKHVAMLGDGINDAPALASSSVSISMGSVGSDVAIENSDIALMNDNLKNIPYLVKLGKKALGIIKFNVISAILIKFLVIFLAIFGISSLTLAIIADVGVTIMVIMNGLRLFGYKS
jgi:Cd2+/Zn2+-exporting ATPase